MGFDFCFRGMQERRELNELIVFLASQDLGYPRYDEWVQRTEYELDSGYKKAVLAFSDRKLVGDIVFQQHKEISSFLELKNMRIHRDFRMRDFASFMLKQMEVDSRKKYDAIVCDAHADNKESIDFMVSRGYSPVMSVPLYDSNTPDIVLLKPLRPESSFLVKRIEKV